MKKIFIVAPFFPPSALPPSQRVRLLVSHLIEFGWYPVVFTVDHYYREDVADPWMTELAGKKFDLITVKCYDQRKTRRFGIGDLGMRMLPFLYHALKKEAIRQKPDLVLYPVPPWYIMAIAPFIKRITRTPFAIDFIDPWVRPLKTENVKSYLSQGVARILEKFVLKKCDVILAVSEGILNDLVKRYPFIKNTPMKAIPYGVELADYKSIPRVVRGHDNVLMFRYIGSISDSMVRVMQVLLEAFQQIGAKHKIQVELIGTSYAGQDIAEGRYTSYIKEARLEDIIREIPARVGYRKAMELTRDSDILVMIGDMTAYYAASKLMGLIASQQPFFAFLQRDSFPAQFLRRLDYKYLVEYTAESGSLPEEMLPAAVDNMLRLISDLETYTPISVETPEFKKNTAWGMTKDFVNTFQ